MTKDLAWALNLSMKEASVQGQMDMVSGGKSKNHWHWQYRTADLDAP